MKKGIICTDLQFIKHSSKMTIKYIIRYYNGINNVYNMTKWTKKTRLY